MLSQPPGWHSELPGLIVGAVSAPHALGVLTPQRTGAYGSGEL